MQLFTVLLYVMEHMDVLSVFNVRRNFLCLKCWKRYPVDFSEENFLLHGDAYSSTTELI